MSTDNKQSLPAITLAAIGVVYGDIGTSPLYTLRECLSGQFGFGVERDAVFGFLSLIFWLLILVVLAHAGAALYHHIQQRDATLVRMLPQGWLDTPQKESA